MITSFKFIRVNCVYERMHNIQQFKSNFGVIFRILFTLFHLKSIYFVHVTLWLLEESADDR